MRIAVLAWGDPSARRVAEGCKSFVFFVLLDDDVVRDDLTGSRYRGPRVGRAKDRAGQGETKDPSVHERESLSTIGWGA